MTEAGERIVEGKPDDVPVDVWETARYTAHAVGAGLSLGSARIIARAILAERARCARVADATANDLNVTAARLYEPCPADEDSKIVAEMHRQGAIVAERVAAAIRNP